MDSEEFQSISAGAKYLLSRARSVSARIERGDDATAERTLLWESYKSLVLADSRPDPRPYYQLIGETTHFYWVDIGWPYKWRTAHNAAVDVAFHLMNGHPTEGESRYPNTESEYLLTADEFGRLVMLLNDERVKVLAKLGTAPTQEPVAPPKANTSLALTDNEYTILRELRDAVPKRVLVVDLAASTTIERKTVGLTLIALASRGLVDYDSKKRGGAAITEAGQSLLSLESNGAP